MTLQILKILLIPLFFLFLLSMGLFFWIFLTFWGIIFSLLSLFVIILYVRIDKIKETTLCFIVKNDQVLMMLRNKKQHDVHKNKYNGLGGRVERGETHKTCILREVMEEAHVILKDYHYTGKVTFKNFGYKKGFEIMYTYVAYDYEQEIGECNEGDLYWIDKDKILDLPLWEGDRYFIQNMIENKPFRLYLHYEDDHVIGHQLFMKKVRR